MTNEQNEIITTIEKMLEMVKSGELPLDMCPISNFRTVYYCALCYANDISSFCIIYDGKTLEQ